MAINLRPASTPGLPINLDGDDLSNELTFDNEGMTNAAITLLVVGIFIFLIGILACYIFPAFIAGAIFVLSGMLVVAGGILCGIIECGPADQH